MPFDEPVQVQETTKEVEQAVANNEPLHVENNNIEEAKPEPQPEPQPQQQTQPQTNADKLAAIKAKLAAMQANNK